MLSRAALGSIWFYQQYVSPRKGFRCAYSVRHGGTGCSGYAKQAIKEHGIISAIPLIKKRFADCKAANIAMHGDADVVMRRKRKRDRSASRSDRIYRRLEAVACCGTIITQSACSMPVGLVEAIDGDCGPSECGSDDCGAPDCSPDCGSCS